MVGGEPILPALVVVANLHLLPGNKRNFWEKTEHFNYCSKTAYFLFHNCLHRQQTVYTGHRWYNQYLPHIAHLPATYLDLLLVDRFHDQAARTCIALIGYVQNHNVHKFPHSSLINKKERETRILNLLKMKNRNTQQNTDEGKIRDVMPTVFEENQKCPFCFLFYWKK